MDDESNLSLLAKSSEPSIYEFRAIVKDIVKNLNILALRQEVQHGGYSRLRHCMHVSYYSYKICKRFNLDYVSAARAAILHDFYYYDWRDKHVEGQKKFHGFRHPRIALNNALDLFDLNEREQNIILRHMWPLTVVPPKYSEAYVVTMVDKYCATHEFFWSKTFKHKEKRKLEIENLKLLEEKFI